MPRHDEAGVNSDKGKSGWRSREGQVLVMFAAGLILLVGMMALSIDAGFVMAERRQAQSAADAGALAAARAKLDYLDQTGSEPAQQSAGTRYAAANATTSEDNVDVDTSPAGLGEDYVEVTVSKDVDRFFLGAFYDGEWSVTASAMASLEPIVVDYALITLSEDGPGVNMIGNVNIVIEGGSAMSNSGMRCNGNGALTADGEVNSHLGFSTTGNCEFIGELGSNPNTPRVEDPLAGTPGPPTPPQPSGLPPGECNQSGNTVTCTPGHYDSTENHNGNLEIIFQPGTYHFDNAGLDLRGNINMTFQDGGYDFYMDGAGIHVSGNTDVVMNESAGANVFFYFRDSSITFQGNTSLEMASGIYYFDGEDFRVEGNQEVSGDDLLLYFDTDASFRHAGNAGFDFTASSTPLYEGMPPNLLFFSAPGSQSTLDLRGNTGIYFDGITYMPDGKVDFRGNPGGVWARGQVIVDEVEFSGNANGLIDYQEYTEIEVPAVWLVQ